MYPIRVLHVVGIMNRGGLETLIMNIYRNIDRNKVQFDFLVHKEEKGVFEKEILELGGKIHRVPYVNKVGHFGYIRALKKFFHNHTEYKIVHSHMNAMSGFILKEAKKANIPIRISHSHTFNPKVSILKSIYTGYSKKFINDNATHKFACSRKAGKWLYGNNVDTVVINNGIELDKFRYNEEDCKQKKRELSIDDSTIVIGHVGSFREAKNHDFLLDVFKYIEKRIDNVVLVLVGDGKLKKNIEQKAENLGIEHKIKFLGVRDDVHDILKIFDFMIFPSIYEGLGLSLIEAQASGVKCIISDVITKEVDMGLNLVDYINLSSPLSEWSKSILDNDKCKNRESNKIKDAILEKGYDIKYTVKYLEKLYVDTSKIMGGDRHEKNTYNIYTNI